MKKFIILCLLLMASIASASEPTTKKRVILNNTPAASINTAAKRLAAITGEVEVSTGDGNEVTFVMVDVSTGAENSGIKYILWHITADGGNATVSGFKVWASSVGFNRSGSVVKFQPISGADQTSESSTENYVVNAEISDYTWATMPESEPASQNLWPSDEGTSMSLSTASDDVVMFAVYLAIANDEVDGTYKGDETGYELQLSFKYTCVAE